MATAVEKWSRNELLDAIIVYKKLQSDPSIVKKEVYRELALKYPNRTPKAFEYRMQNISFVLSLAGREWIEGLKPAKNVGTNVIREIEEILSSIEDRVFDERVIQENNTEEARRKTPQKPPDGNVRPQKTIVASTQYAREPELVAWVLENAEGRCELCSKKAPFTKISGYPFLEVHHVKHLADGGSDTISNAVALCPNCHRELHYGMESNQKKSQLYDKIKRLILE